MAAYLTRGKNKPKKPKPDHPLSVCEAPQLCVQQMKKHTHFRCVRFKK